MDHIPTIIPILWESSAYIREIQLTLYSYMHILYCHMETLSCA
jgi:hypothetical protein